jgi:AraC-like DNA-binding protein
MRYMRDMVAAAEAAGIPRERVLGWAGGLEADTLNAQKARVSLPQFSRLYGALALQMHDEGAGLSSRRLANGVMETICRAGITTLTLTEAVDALSKALNAMAQGMTVQPVVDDSSFRIVIAEIEPVVERRQSTYEVLLLTIYAVLSWLVGRRPPLLSVDFPCPAPRHLFELRTLFAGPVRFNQSHAALRFPASQSALPVVRAVGELPKLLKRAPGSLIETLIHRGGLTLAIRKQLHVALPEQLPIEEAAKQLSMSARTLHRKLVAEGTTFQKIKDELRRDVAIHALTRTNLPLKKIAEIVGFQDQSSFQRAFLLWTGRSPGMTRSRSTHATR